MSFDSSVSTERSETPQERAEQLIFRLMETYQDPLFRYLYFRTSSRSIAKDLVQDVFTKTWTYLAQGKVIAQEEAFMYRVAKNALIDFYKKKKTLSLDFLSESGYEPETPNERALYEKESDIALIHTLIEGLSEEQKQIISLRFLEEKSLEEIARIFGKTTNAMTVKIHRILASLRTTARDYD